MIKFFRKRRQKILTEKASAGKASKFSKPPSAVTGAANGWRRTMGRYLIYAIGEIVLVVIGILIALSINNWNQKRLNKIKAVEYHQRLIEDLDFIIEGNKNTHDLALKVMNSISQTIGLLEKGKIENDEEKEIINYAMIMFSRLSRQISYLSTWEEMQNSGDFNLIYNLELRKNIDALQGLIDLAHEVFSKHASAIRNNMTIYSRHMRTYVDSETMNETVIPNFDAMAADPQFINQFSLNVSSWRSQASFAENIADNAIELKKQLQSELEILLK
jgi:hypothetical protein